MSGHLDGPPPGPRRPWPIAPDTVMPPRRQPVRWGSRADDPPTDIHDDPQRTKAYLAGLAAGRAEAAAASPDERLREAVAALPQYVITIQDREGYTYERGCAGQPMNYTGVMLADVEALVGELKDRAPAARKTTNKLKEVVPRSLLDHFVKESREARAAFDAVVAERDEAVKKLGIAIDVTHEFEDEKIALADRLAKWERGEWPSTEAQHGVLLDQIKELAAERDAASEVLALIYVMLTGAEPMWAEMPFDERCARAANEAQQAFLAVSGSSEPPKESA